MTPEVLTEEERAEDAWSYVDALPRVVHRVEWSLESGGHLRGVVVCTGDDGSPCRAYCPSDCEVSPCVHPPKFGKQCGIVPWFEDGAEEYYGGPATSPRDEPIELIWHGDGYDWKYASDVTELERTNGDLGVAIREAAAARHALRYARPLVKLDHSAAGIETLALVDAALDQRLAR